MNEVLNNILTRRSIRKFKDRQISREELDNIILAGTYAPSGKNNQSYKITVLYNSEKVEKLNKDVINALDKIEIDDNTPESVIEMKKRAKNPDTQLFFKAPTFIIVSNEEGYLNAMADSTCVMENMMLAAHSMGIGSCWINILVRLNGYKEIREIAEALGVPENHKICGGLVLGYPDQPHPKAHARKEGTVNIIM